MNKYILIIVCWSFLAIRPAYPVRLGLRAGLHLSEPDFGRKMLQTDNLTGFQAGPVIEFLSLAGLGLEAAVLYSQQGFRIDRETIRNQAIDVPLNLKYKIGLVDFLGIYASAGPYARFKISGNRSSIKEISEQINRKTFDAGLNLGFGFEAFRRLQIGANYQLTKTWSVIATYFF